MLHAHSEDQSLVPKSSQTPAPGDLTPFPALGRHARARAHTQQGRSVWIKDTPPCRGLHFALLTVCQPLANRLLAVDLSFEGCI